MKKFEAVKVADNVHWVGAIDWGLREFHGYRTSEGSTYNAYLITGEKNILVDTVKAPFFNEMMSRIESVIDPSKIDYIISNHSEMDHTGAIVEAMNAVKPDKIFASTNGVKALTKHFNLKPDVFTPVKSGDSIDVDKEKVLFVDTKMLHWPDSMVSYYTGSKILFSQDAFGMHLASSQRFADELPQSLIYKEAATYYANILMPFSSIVAKQVKDLGSLNLDIKVLAPDHGPIWRTEEEINWIINQYTKWAEQKPTKKVVVVYDTMWKSTELMARSISDGLIAGGCEVKFMSLHASFRSDIATELLEAGGFLIGSPTINQQVYPTIADVLVYLKGLKPKNLLAAAFGSYGWSGEAIKDLTDILTQMKLTQPMEPLKLTYVPNNEELVQCREFGLQFSEQINKALGQ